MTDKYIVKNIIEKRKYPNWIKTPINENGESLDLYISTYPIVANYLANRIQDKNKIFAEFCCGIGISLIYFSNKFKKLIGIDNNENALKYCKKNLDMAKKDSNFALKDYSIFKEDISNINLLKELNTIDIVAYDIPYWFDHGQNLTQKNPNLKNLISNIRKNITSEIIIYAPPYIEFNEIFRQLGRCEFQQIYLNGKHDRNLIYFGDLIEKEGITKIQLEY